MAMTLFRKFIAAALLLLSCVGVNARVIEPIPFAHIGSLKDVVEARFPRGIRTGLQAVTGNVVLGLSGLVYYTGTYPHIDITKTASEINLNNSAVPGVNFSSLVPEGAVDVSGNQSPFGAGKYLDNNGDLLSSLPAGTISYNRILWDQSAGGPYDYLNPSPAAMTVDWQGGSAGWTVTVSGNGGPFASGNGTTPLTFTWPSTTQVTLNVTGSGANPPKQVRIYKTADQALLNAGKVLSPGYRDQAIAGAKYLRFMDWQNTNWNLVASSISNYPALANVGWANGNRGIGTVNNNITGVPLDVITGAVTETNKNPWIVIPEGFANKNIIEIQSISRSSTPVVTTYGPHAFSNGDTVIFSDYSPFASSLLTNPTSYATSTFTVSGVNVLSNDTPIVFGILANGSADSSTYPTGITKGTSYWTVNATSTTYQIASSVGGSPLALTGSMTGTINVLENYNGNLVSGQWGQFKRLTSYSASTWTLNGHGLANGTPVMFGVPPTVPFNINGDDLSTYPTGITKFYTYYVVNATANTFQTSLTVGGSAMTLSGSMTGSINLWLQLSRNRFTVANVTANTFEITGPGANTSGYYGKSQRISGVGSGVVFSPYDLTTMDTRIAAFVNYVRPRMAANIEPIWEFGNEIWNPQFSAFYNNGSQIPDSYTPDGVFGNAPTYSYMNGYLTAAIAHSVRKAYGGHSGYKFAMGGNQSCCDQLGGTYGAVAGALKYLADHGGGLTITDIFDHLSVTSYLGTVTYVPNGDPVGVTFGTNTIAFSGNVGPNVAADVGFPIKLNTANPGGTLPTGLTAGSTNYVQTFNTLVGGSGYVDGTYTNVPLTGGAGTGLLATRISVSGGSVIEVFGAAKGTTPYAVGNTLSASNVNLGGSGSGFSINVASIDTTGNYGYPSGSGQIYWTVGSSPNFGLATTPGGSPLTFTGGSGSNTATIASEDVVQSLMATSQSLHGSNPATYPSDWTYISDKIAEDIYDARWTGGETQQSCPKCFTVLWQLGRYNYYITNYTAVGKQLAGLSLIAYEGGESNVPTGGMNLFYDPTWRAMFAFAAYSAGSATNFMQIYTLAKQTGLIANQAQFLDVGILSYNYDYGVFGAKQYIGDNNPRWLGVVNTNALN